MSPHERLGPRQIWARPTSTTSTPKPHCTPFSLPSNGILTINGSTTVTLTQDAIFSPQCTGDGSYTAVDGTPSTISNLRDPFYSSTAPQMYAIGAATIISYLLVIMLFITPRTYFVGGPGGGTGFLGRRGMISGSYGNPSIVGVGGRPWLQKVAATTVAISMTIATADTYRVAKHQYNMGYEDSTTLTNEVVGGLEIRIVRLISTTFLWLAQVQTLIRLFPRHKEKVVIKWTGFALIVLDTTFSVLNSFVNSGQRTKPRSFQDAVPALTYLFELGIGILYAACVIYYSLSKRRFAFFHPGMRNICLVAALALCAVLVPVIFFVLDVSKPDVSGWGDYIRWVGAAAASVVVWEWVERIEALERDERKDGILGREIFDGDEMLEVTPSDEIDWPGRRPNGDDGQRGGSGVATGYGTGDHRNPVRNRMGFRYQPLEPTTISQPPQAAVSGALPRRTERRQSPSTATVTPVSRADTTSAASTVYAVRHHTLGSPSPEDPVEIRPELGFSKEPSESSTADITISSEDIRREAPQVDQPSRDRTILGKRTARPIRYWLPVPNPFKRQRSSPPPEVAAAQASDKILGNGQDVPLSPDTNGRWQFKSRLANFAGPGKHRLQSQNEGNNPDSSRPTVVVPAPMRGSTQQLQQLSRSIKREVAAAESRSIWSDRNRTPSTSLPIKVIPAPVRGQTTWSPEDLEEVQEGLLTSGVAEPQLDSMPEQTPGHQRPDQNGRDRHVQVANAAHMTNLQPELILRDLPGQIISRRGTLTISEEGSRLTANSPPLSSDPSSTVRDPQRPSRVSLSNERNERKISSPPARMPALIEPDTSSSGEMPERDECNAVIPPESQLGRAPHCLGTTDREPGSNPEPIRPLAVADDRDSPHPNVSSQGRA